MGALGWASVAGLLGLWLTTATATYDGMTSSQPSVMTQVSSSVLPEARQHVDPATILPAPVRVALGECLLVAAPLVLMIAVLRRPANRHTPRAPPVAFAR
jgi:hypothetical protein